MVEVSFTGGGNRSNRRKPRDLSLVTDKLFPNNVVSNSQRTVCVGRYQSNYHTITITTRLNNLSLVCLYVIIYFLFIILTFFFFFCHTEKKKNVQIIKRKYIMTNINTQETDYSVYITTASLNIYSIPE